MKPKIVHVVGARPQFIKAAVVCRELAVLGKQAPIDAVMIHTGQHYDQMLSDTFFTELDIPAPDYNLGVGSGSACSQTARVIDEIGPALEKEQPAAVLLYGDTNSTVGAAVAAHKLTIPVIHLEAGVRIYRRNEQPEETNRVITDHSSALCLACTKRAWFNLRREGMAESRLALVGDPMYELFEWATDQLPRLKTATPKDFGLTDGEFHLSTIHRAENTATPEILVSILDALAAADLPVLLPVHPRVRGMLKEINYAPPSGLKLIEPIGYFDLISLLIKCKRVATDSGGVTREAFFAGKPSIVPRVDNCWAEITEAGWTMAADDSKELTTGLNGFEPVNERPEGVFGQGDTGSRIVTEIESFISRPHRDGPWHLHGFADGLPATVPTQLTYTDYRRILSGLTDLGYSFASFEDSKALLNSDQPVVLLNHDIQLSLGKALEMAEIEADLSIGSTYLLNIASGNYSVFHHLSTGVINQILGFGHQLGLLFDRSGYPEQISIEELGQACMQEARMLGDWFNTSIKVVTVLGTTDLELQLLSNALEDVVFTNLPLITGQTNKYSDSEGFWSPCHPLQAEEVRSSKPLQLSIHPIWWNKDPVSPYETLLRFSQRRFDALEDSLSRDSEVYLTAHNSGDYPG